MTEPVRGTAPPTLTPDELRTLFLFEALDDDQLAWLSAHGRVEEDDVGLVFSEGEDATCFYLLLERHDRMRRRVGQDDVELTRTSQRGVYAGADADLPRRQGRPALRRIHARRDALPPLRAAGGGRSPRCCASGSRWRCTCSRACSSACATTPRSSGSASGSLALGSLTAGLTHELNNPAAAAVRATALCASG